MSSIINVHDSFFNKSFWVCNYTQILTIIYEINYNLSRFSTLDYNSHYQLNKHLSEKKENSFPVINRNHCSIKSILKLFNTIRDLIC